VSAAAASLCRPPPIPQFQRPQLGEACAGHSGRFRIGHCHHPRQWPGAIHRSWAGAGCGRGGSRAPGLTTKGASPRRFTRLDQGHPPRRGGAPRLCVEAFPPQRPRRPAHGIHQADWGWCGLRERAALQGRASDSSAARRSPACLFALDITVNCIAGTPALAHENPCRKATAT